MKNWKTTSAGILTIVGSITGLVFAVINHHIDPAVITGASTGILTGVGLVLSKDFNVTGAGADATTSADKDNSKPQN